MKKLKFKSIGIFGGSFDPPHHGHLKIALSFLKKIKSSHLYWLITEKNPFKKKIFESKNFSAYLIRQFNLFS